MNSNIAETLEKTIIRKVKHILDEGELPDTEYVATDSLAEALEKLVIVHIRTWMLEDAIQAATTDEEIANLKRKIDTCFKIKRPQLVEAINIMMDEAVLFGRSLKEDSVKLYKGVK